MAKQHESYEDFVSKFIPKKTTDDCYTPEGVYNGVRDFVCKKYDIAPESIIRPFWPGGDYKSEDYTGRVVLDNPPFSIMSEIVNFYGTQKIPFFLFTAGRVLPAPLLKYRLIIVGEEMTALNGARVKINFVTSYGRQGCIVTCPALGKILKAGNPQKKRLPKYEYPPCVLSAVDLEKFAKTGKTIEIHNFKRVSALESQRQHRKSIFGGGILVSNNMAAQISKRVKKQADFVWTLNPDEQAIVDKLSESKEL